MMRGGNYKNPCLTMHQPWASLLVYGIKRIEGRSWPAPIRGRLWIHAASKVPDEATIKAMEEFYQEIYAVNGITDIQFPQHYPVSRLIGCVEVVGCVSCEELQSWEALPEGVRLEGQTNFCWLCEQPQKLIIPFEMRGYQGVYNLEKKVYEGAARGLTPAQSPFPVKFPLPDPKDPFSLKPGSISCTIQEKKLLKIDQHTSLTAAIAGARAAATQFSNKGQILPRNNIRDHETRSKNKATKEDAESIDNTGNEPSGTAGVEAAAADDSTCGTRSKQISEAECSGSSSSKVEDDTKLKRNYNVESNKRSVDTKREEKNRGFDPGAARIMAAAFRNLKPSS